MFNDSYPISGAVKNSSSLQFENTFISNFEEPFPITFDVHFGTGLSVPVKVFGVGVDVGYKQYYSLSDIAEKASITHEVTAEATIVNKLKVGTSGYIKVDAISYEHLEKSGYAGLIVGNDVIGINRLQKGSDFILETTIGLYLGAGGDLSCDINVSQILRSIFGR